MKRNIITLSVDFGNQEWRVDFSPEIYEESQDPTVLIQRQATMIRGKFCLDPERPRSEMLFLVWKDVSWAINSKLHCDAIEESK